MEGERWHVFQDAVFAQDRVHDWRREGMYLLQTGDRLTVLADDECVLWRGVLVARRLCWFSRKVSPHEPEWHPVDVTVETWQGWFRQRPALAARLERHAKSR